MKVTPTALPEVLIVEAAPGLLKPQALGTFAEGVLVQLASLLGASAAFAHAHLKSATPAADSSVAAPNVQTLYLDVDRNKAKTLGVGFTDFKNGTDYTDYSLALGYDLGDGYSVKGAFVGANKKAVYGDINKNRLVVTFAKAM